jgi:hypothetical protein
VSQPLTYASESACAAKSAAADNEQRHALTPGDLGDLLGRIAELLDRRRFKADLMPDGDDILHERRVRLRAAIGDVDEGDPRLMGAGDPACELDTAPGIGGTVRGYQDFARKVPALRWRARNEYRKLSGVHSCGRGATENDVSRKGIIRAADHE